MPLAAHAGIFGVAGIADEQKLRINIELP